MSRIMNTDLPRRKIEPQSEFEAYWRDHEPTVADLAELFKLSERRVRELFKEGWLEKNRNLASCVQAYQIYRADLARMNRGGREPAAVERRKG